MATNPRIKLGLTRDQLASFLKDHEQIKQFENLFKVADTIAPDVVNEVSIAAGIAQSSAAQALDEVAALAQNASLDDAVMNAKIQQALDAIGRLNNVVDMLESAPAIQNNNSIVADYIDFNNNPPHFDRARRLVWNNVDQTADLGMDYGVIQQIGQEVYARVANTTGVTIPNGTVVGFVGSTLNALLVSPYLADGAQPSLYIVGIMTHDLPDSGQKGYCTTWGFVRNMNTSAFAVGDLLYASPTVAGALTNVKPTAPHNVIPIAACIISDAVNGVIFVRPTIEQQKYYGVFTKTTGQTPAATNTEYLLTFDNTQLSNGIAIGTPASRITVPQSGLYNFDATIQLTSGSSSAKNIWVWWKKNGSNVPNSARIVTSDINNGYIPIALSEFFSLAANDYMEIAFASDSTNITVDAVAATAFAPSAPSIVLNVTQVQQ